MKELGRRICNLLTIKSIVTLILTCCFAFLAIRGSVGAEVFISIYSVRHKQNRYRELNVLYINFLLD